ncbi:hypothetical protein [Aquabacter spiritensis]|uniref:hypothetical protein n=1 Tax=Aquabacter spiritensis TaxID=933073 RepID=UPI001047DF94|nr:hypothetical protein [Aquabacter spiritensis]
MVVYKNMPHMGFVSELTVGGAVYHDANKARDLWIAPVAIVLQIAAALVALGWARRLSSVPRFDTFAEYAPSHAVLVAVLVLLLSLAAIAGDLVPLAILILLGLGVVLLRAGFGIAWTAPFGLVFSLSALFAWGCNQFGILDVRLLLSAAYLPLCLAALVLRGRTRLLRAAYGLTGLALAGATARAAPVLWMPTSAYAGPTVIDAVIWIAAAGVAVQTLMFLRSPAGKSFSRTPAFPLAAAFLLLAVFRQSPFGLPFDDYHYGERLLAARALWEGRLFETFFSPHGFSDALGGLGALLIGDRSAIGVAIGKIYADVFILLILAWQMVRQLGPAPAILLLVALQPNLIFPVPLVVLMIVAILRSATPRNDYAAGAAIALAAATTIFLLNGIGVAIAVPSALAALFLFRDGTRRGLVRACCAGAICALALFAAFPRAFLGEIAFLATSARTNAVLYGNNFVVRASDLASLVEIGTALMFLLTPMLAFALLVRPGQSRGHSWTWIGLAVLPVVALVLLLAPYALGRLDVSLPRASFATAVTLVFLAFWITAPQIRDRFLSPGAPRTGFVQAGIAALLLVTALPTFLHVWASVPLMPPPAPLGALPPAPLPAMGMAQADRAHLDLIASVKRTTDALLRPDETYLDLTNRNALYFYLDRAIPVPISGAYNAAPRAFQELNLAYLAANPPPLALVGAENFEHDGYTLPLRSFLLYRDLLERYRPFLAGSILYGIRSDQTDRLTALPAAARRPVTSVTCHSGTAIAGDTTWSLRVQEPLAGRLVPGDFLNFYDGVARTVVAVHGEMVRLTPPLPPDVSGARLPFKTEAPATGRDDADLWAQVFNVCDFGRLPSAWGRSLAKLSGAVGATRFPLPQAGMTDATRAGDGRYRIVGRQPGFLYDVPAGLNPAQNGLLVLEVRCAVKRRMPHIEIAWRGAGQGFSAERSVWFAASFPVNLVPLDAAPRWFLAPSIAQIRITVEPPADCGGLILRDVALTGRL